MPEDYPEILRLTYEAFLTLDFPGRRRPDEHFLLSLLHETCHIIPGLCFVALADGTIAGHILYTKSKITRPGKEDVPTVTFGPLSVSPGYQRQGIGKLLVSHSIRKARGMGLLRSLSSAFPNIIRNSVSHALGISALCFPTVPPATNLWHTS